MIWASVCDWFDGLRARRMKCGSAFGRILDETADQISFFCYSNMMMYLFNLPRAYNLIFLFFNLVWFSIELRSTLCKKLTFSVGFYS